MVLTALYALGRAGDGPDGVVRAGDGPDGVVRAGDGLDCVDREKTHSGSGGGGVLRDERPGV